MIQSLTKSLKTDEGFRDHIYLDKYGKPTGGWGHYFKVGSLLPLAICEMLFMQDLLEAIENYYRIPENLTQHFNRARQKVIIQMLFNLGYNGVMGFKKMWKYAEVGAFAGVAMEMLDSKWAREDVGSRADELAEIMRDGHE